MSGKRLKITDAEMLIMKVLWNSERTLTSNEILDQLQETNWKITTLITLAGKLIDKGFVQSVKIGRSHAHQYSAVITESEYKYIQTQGFLQSIHKGSLKSLFSTLFENYDLNPEEVDELKQFIKEKGKKEKENG